MPPRRPFPSTPRYAVVRELGRGGVGSVYLARDSLEDEREVALKVCHQRIAPEEILREFRILRELRHPGIARAFDFGRLAGSGQTYFTMEYVEGRSLEKESTALRRELRGGNPAPLLAVFVQIASALGYLHRRGLLHLDLKPSNIVFSREQVKLIDFGLFQSVHLQDARRARGTAHYSAPELLDGTSVDCRADLYSLGVTLSSAAAGILPITGTSLAEIAEGHRRAPPRLPRELPHEILEIIAKLLAKSPAERFASAAEVERALRAAARSLLGGAGELQVPVRSALQPLEFAGRKRELDAFFTWIDELRRGKGPRVLEVVGGAGIGKSRFVDACRTEIAGLGVQCLSNISSAGPAAGKHAGLGRILQGALILNPPARQQRVRCRFLLTALGLASHAASRKEIGQLDLDQIRARVFREAMSLLAEPAGEPLIIIVEDLHRAEAQLLDFVRRFHELPPEEVPGRLGLLVTSRSEPDPRRERDGSRARAIRLKPLTRQEAAGALAGVEGLEPREASRLAARCQGNPGHLATLLYHHLSREGSREGHGAPAPAADPGEILSRRLAELDGDGRAVILPLLLLERPATEALARAGSGLDRKRFRTAVEALASAEVLAGTKRGYFLTHAVLAQGPPRDLARRAFTPDEVRAAHARIGALLEGDLRRQEEAAHHLFRSAATERGLACARRAEAELRAAGRIEEAVAACSEALEHAPRGEDRAFFLERLGDLEERSGQFDRAGKAYDDLLEELGAFPRSRLRVLRKRGGIHQRSGMNDLARQSFEEALLLLEKQDDLDEHLHLLNEMAGLHLFRGDFPKATTFAKRGLERLGSRAARRLDEGTRALHALNLYSIAGQILLRQCEYDRAAEEYLKSLKHAGRVGTPSTTALILNNLGVAYHQANRLSDALRVYRRATALARRLGDETALFSIQCNTAGIHARRGDLKRAEEELAETERMPHSLRSKRARLFFLHSKGLVERLALRNVRPLWEESIRLADELPDPLFAGHGRVYLLENDILEGRWAAARRVLAELAKLPARDPRLERAVVARHAYLAALCGSTREASALAARSLLPDRFSPARVERPHYGQLWDWVFGACALMELADHSRAREWLERTRRAFADTRQSPGALECSLLLSELELRCGSPDQAARHLREARKALSAHDSVEGSRGARVRIPFLEARIELLSPRRNRARVAKRLAEAAASLPFGAAWEIAWHLDLLETLNGELGAKRKLETSRARFAAGLADDDRAAYLARNHLERLGLERPESAAARLGPESAGPESADEPEKRLGAILELRRERDAERALDLILEACGARGGGAIFVEDARATLAWRSPPGARRRRDRERLRQAALAAGDGPLEGGLSARITLPDGRRLGVLWVAGAAPAREGQASGAAELLALAAEVLSRALSPPRPSSARAEDAGAPRPETPAHTRTIIRSAFVGGASRRMHELLALVRRTQDSNLPVLLTGESGTGKDHLARWIHALSPRRHRPFVGLDCSAIPEALLEAELFGHTEGAFTGAERARQGYLLAAQGGTFYLDHIDSLAPETQTKLLRVLEQGEFRPLGSDRTLRIEARFIASTQRDLSELSGGGEFRPDLYYRLAGICLTLPPLRERVEDIPDLVDHFRKQSLPATLEFTAEALDALKVYPWPGNVRELESLVRRLALTSDGPVDEAEILRGLGIKDPSVSFPSWLLEGRSYKQLAAALRRDFLLYLFDRFDGDMDLVARELGTTKRTAYHHFAQAGLKTVDLRARGQEG
jgi:DNA-binding NtrC family response regulator/tetratricopeptide (TPR) repeat protein/predicted Ser/Thr protein kinase